MFDQEPPLNLVEEGFPTDLPSCAAPHASPLPSFWTSHYSGSLENANSTGPLPLHADVVIIGSGLTGSCVAARLVEGLVHQRRGLALGEDAVGSTVSVLVLEGRQFCSGATGRNGGHLTPAPRLHFRDIADASSVENAKRSVELEDRAAKWVIDACEAEGWVADVDLVQGGCVHLYKDQASEDAVRRQVAAAAAEGIDVSSCTWLTAEQALSEYGATTHSALRTPGNNLFPLKFVARVFSRAQSQSASTGIDLQLYTSTMVDSVTPLTATASSSARWTVRTSRGDISAKYVVHATNAYASHLLPHLSAGRHCIVPTRGQVIALAPSLTSNPRWSSAFSASQSFEYFFQRPQGGSVVLGGGRAFAGPRFEFGITDDASVNPVVGKALRDYLGEQFPSWFGEDKGRVEQEWTGIMGYRPSGEPLVGKVYVAGKELEGQFVSAGYSGHGMTRAPACAEVVASMLLADMAGETFEPPSWFPTHYLSTSEVSLDSGVSRWCTVS